MRSVGASVLITGLCWTAASGFEVRLANHELQEAVDIGQSRVERVRNAYHASYRTVVSRPPIDYIEVVTPFRRIVLAAEEQWRLGGRPFGQRDALAVLEGAPQEVDLIIEITFHPMNTYVGVPDYNVSLVGRSARIPLVDPLRIERVPRLGPRLPGPPTRSEPGNPLETTGDGQPLIGGTVIAKLDGTRMDPRGVYDLLVVENRAVVAETTIDFGKLR